MRRDGMRLCESKSDRGPAIIIPRTRIIPPHHRIYHPLIGPQARTAWFAAGGKSRTVVSVGTEVPSSRDTAWRSFPSSPPSSFWRSASSLSARPFKKLRYVCQQTPTAPANRLRYSKGTTAKLKAVTAGHNLHELMKLTGTVWQTRRQASPGESPERSAL